MLKTRKSRSMFLGSIPWIGFYIGIMSIVWNVCTHSDPGLPASHHSWLWFQGAGIVFTFLGCVGGLALGGLLLLCERISDVLTKWVANGKPASDKEMQIRLLKDLETND